QRLLVDLLALAEVDRAPRVPAETGVEEAPRILQSGPLGEGHLHDLLVRLARAEDPVVVPRRNAAPLPLLDDVGIGVLDQGAEPAEELAPPVVELGDSLVDQLGRRLARLRVAVLHGCPLFFVPGFDTCAGVMVPSRTRSRPSRRRCFGTTIGRSRRVTGHKPLEI